MKAGGSFPASPDGNPDPELMWDRTEVSRTTWEGSRHKSRSAGQLGHCRFAPGPTASIRGRPMLQATVFLNRGSWVRCARQQDLSWRQRVARSPRSGAEDTGPVTYSPVTHPTSPHPCTQAASWGAGPLPPSGRDRWPMGPSVSTGGPWLLGLPSGAMKRARGAGGAVASGGQMIRSPTNFQAGKGARRGDISCLPGTPGPPAPPPCWRQLGGTGMVVGWLSRGMSPGKQVCELVSPPQAALGRVPEPRAVSPSGSRDSGASWLGFTSIRQLWTSAPCPSVAGGSGAAPRRH